MKYLALVMLVACGSDHGAGIDAPATPDAPPIDAARTLALSFARIPGSQTFDAIATLDGAADPSITLAVDRGSLGAVTQTAAGTQARVTPAGTGHHVVTATAGALTATRTALVLATVDDAWDQPEPVPGLVDTLGWEDGPSISPDGSVLTFQYLPVSISCLIGNDPTAPACKVIGPIDAPARPHMPGASRVSGDTYVNGCPSLGAPTLTFPVPPNSLYAAHRQADGSFGDLHPIYYAGDDGCISAFGLQLLDGSGTAVYAFDDPRHLTGDGARVFRATLDTSTDVVLGTFAIAGGAIQLNGHLGTPIGDPDGPTQGNPGLYTNPDGTVVLFSDDEQGRQDLFFNTAPSATGAYAGQQLIPSPVSVPGMQESQPFFDGHTLMFRRDLVVLSTAYSGGPMGMASSWTTPITVLAPGTDTTAGSVVVVGEPSFTLTAATRELYFVYAREVGDGTLDLDIGRVRAR